MVVENGVRHANFNAPFHENQAKKLARVEKI